MTIKGISSFNIQMNKKEKKLENGIKISTFANKYSKSDINHNDYNYHLFFQMVFHPC